MTATNYSELLAHKGHKIVCVTYRDDKHIHDVALECETCNEVLLDYDNPNIRGTK